VNKLFYTFVGILVVILLSSSIYASKIKNFILDSSRIYEIKVAGNKTGTTTVMFPSIIGSLQGANITDKDGVNAGFKVIANKNSYFFSIQALKSKAVGSVNIVYDHRIYVLKLITADEKDAYSSVNFQKTDQVYGSLNHGGSVTPTLIRDLIEKARLYKVLFKQYPDYYENVEISQRNQLFSYTAYSVLLQNVYRFKNDDTNVFEIIIKNNTDEAMVFDPNLIAVRLNSKMFYSSVSVASGKVPPHGESPVWFAVTSTTEGSKNNMAADNNWQVLLTASSQNNHKSVLDVNTEIIEKEQSIKAQIATINKRLNDNSLTDGEISLLGNRISELSSQLSDLESYHKISHQ
jgi:hypothetical protein